MGADVSVMGSVECGEELGVEGTGLGLLWSSLIPARYKNTRTPVSLFLRHHPEPSSPETLQFFRNGIKRLKQLRHPGILHFVAASSEAGQTVLVTERVQPLELALSDLEPVEALAGLTDLLNALVFLHDKAGMCHNNLSPASVLIAVDGSWRLGGLECACEGAESRHWIASDFAKAVKQAPFVAPEDQDLLDKADFPVHARDAFAFGQLVEFVYRETLQGRVSPEQEDALEEVISQTTQENGCLRPQLAVFSHSKAFNNELSSIASFLERFPAVDDEASEEFFKSLRARLVQVPARLYCRRLGKALLSRYVFLSPPARLHFLPHFLTPSLEGEEEEKSGGIVPEGLFARYLCPELGRAFCVHEVSLRLTLLQYLPAFIHSFSDTILRNVLLPELLLGMRDTQEEIVAGSLRGLAALVPLLGAAEVTGLQHKKYFHEGRPKAPIGSVGAGETSPLSAESVSAPNEQRGKRSEEEGVLSCDEGLGDRTGHAAAKAAAREARAAQRRLEVEARKATRLAHQAAIKAQRAATFPSSPSPTSSPQPEEEEETWDGWDATESSEGMRVGEDEDAAMKLSGGMEGGEDAAGLLRAALTLKTRELAAKTRLDLGSEFDINALEVKLVEEEEDLFADMAPKLSENKSKSLREPREADPSPVQSTLFAAQSTSMEADGGGWDDEDWE